MNPLIIAIISIALSVAAQFSLKAGMSGEAVRAVLARPLGFGSLVSVLTDKYVFFGFLVGEDVTLTRAMGVALICAGVFVVGRS